MVWRLIDGFLAFHAGAASSFGSLLGITFVLSIGNFRFFFHGEITNSTVKRADSTAVLYVPVQRQDDHDKKEQPDNCGHAYALCIFAADVNFSSRNTIARRLQTNAMLSHSPNQNSIESAITPTP